MFVDFNQGTNSTKRGSSLNLPRLASVDMSINRTV